MRRREFIGVLASSEIAVPLPLCAQQPERVRHIGVFMNAAEDDAQSRFRVGAFLQGLKELGWTDGRTFGLNIAGALLMPGGFRNMRKNWSRPRQTSFWLRAARPWDRADRIRYRIRDCTRSCQCRLRRQPGSSWWQRHRFSDVRIRHQREMAGTAQEDRAGRDAGGSPSGSSPHRFGRTARSSPLRRHFA